MDTASTSEREVSEEETPVLANVRPLLRTLNAGMTAILRSAKRAALVPATILLIGESGAGVVDGAVRGHQNYGEVWILFLDGSEQLESVHLGHPPIAQNQVEFPLGKHFERSAAALRIGNLMAAPAGALYFKLRCSGTVRQPICTVSRQLLRNLSQSGQFRLKLE